MIPPAPNPEVRRKVEALIAERNAAVRRDHEQRYGKALPDEPEQARHERIMRTPEAWDRIA